MERERYVTIAGFTLWHIWKIRCVIIFDTVQMYMDTLISQIGNCCRVKCIPSVAQDEEQTEAYAALEAIKWPRKWE
ncbi:hypothetical protein C5167_023181 [Papaver somniferum]|uniref:Uncharacterized protein n=1 Tax=Papaver somniferum TaxID=3469 RepID=A0A4Y7JK23_PAPSO|nr:hypothetical protein C5167_023181 [Papaver somniferum]